MTIKRFYQIRILIAIIVAGTMSYSIVRESYVIPIIVAALGASIVFYLRGRVKEVIADERDYEIGGKAARYAIQIYSWIALITMFVLYVERGQNESYALVSAVLAYSTCVLLILYSLIFKYYGKAAPHNKKFIFMTLAGLLLLALAVFGVRLFSGEDDWLCKDGQWIKHGQPSRPAPTEPCR